MKIEYSDDYTTAIKHVLSWEGAYVFDPKDPGGETKYGISKRQYPHLNIKALTSDEATQIYYTDYWLRNWLEKINDQKIAARLLDLCVNIGGAAAVKLIQKIVNVPVDGCMGHMTLSAINTEISLDPDILYKSLIKAAADYYRGLISDNPSLQIYEKGWLNRLYN